MGTLFTVGYRLILIGAGVYAIMIGKNWLPKKNTKEKNEGEEDANPNKTQYVIAGIILVYFGVSSLYTLFI